MSSIARRPNGRWRARFRDACGAEHAKHFATRAQAQAWLDHAEAAQHTGTWAPPRAGRATLRAYYARFADRQVWQPTTRRSVDHAIATSPLGGTPLAAIGRADVERWVRSMVDDGLAPTTVRTRAAALRTVLGGAVRDGLIGVNPAATVRLPRAATRSRTAVLPTPDALRAALQVADPRLAVVIALAAQAGLRLGEARGLQVRDLDLACGALTVRRQVRAAAGGGWETAEPKYGSVRTVPMPAELTGRLRSHLNACGSRLQPVAWVVPGAGVRPVHPGTVHRLWEACKERSGLDPALRLHDLRHLYASTLIAAGVDVLTVQRRLGHARASTTLDVYGHVLPAGPHAGSLQAAWDAAGSMPVPESGRGRAAVRS